MIRLEKNIEDKIIDLLDRGEYKISYHRSIHSWGNHFIVDVGCIRYKFNTNSASTPYMSSMRIYKGEKRTLYSWIRSKNFKNGRPQTHGKLGKKISLICKEYGERVERDLTNQYHKMIGDKILEGMK